MTVRAGIGMILSPYRTRPGCHLMGLLITHQHHRIPSKHHNGANRTVFGEGRVEARMKPKKVLLLVAAAVLIYTLIAHPTQLGDGVQALLGWIGDGLEAIIAFLKSAVD